MNDETMSDLISYVDIIRERFYYIVDPGTIDMKLHAPIDSSNFIVALSSYEPWVEGLPFNAILTTSLDSRAV